MSGEPGLDGQVTQLDIVHAGETRLSGARPFDHESKVTLLGMHVTAPVPKMSERAPEAAVPPEVLEKIVAKIPLKRLGKAEEIAATIAFLASDAAAYITGQNIRVDGGITRSV